MTAETKARPARQFCRDLCLSRAEPVIGVGRATTDFVLLHWPRAHWRVPRTAAHGMPEVLSRAIEAAHATGFHVALVDGDDIGLSYRQAILRGPSAPEAAEALLRLSRGEPLAPPEALGHDPRKTILCCTDAKMDPCCARYGFATWKALRAAADPAEFRVLQSTHLGGCRFAASLLVLPDRSRYARLEPGQVPDFLAALRAGQPYLPAWRGHPELEAAAQVADHAARVFATEAGLGTDFVAEPVLEEITPPGAGPAAQAVFQASLAGTRLRISLRGEDFAVNTRCRTLGAEDAPGRVRRWRVASVVAG